MIVYCEVTLAKLLIWVKQKFDLTKPVDKGYHRESTTVLMYPSAMVSLETRKPFIELGGTVFKDSM